MSKKERLSMLSALECQKARLGMLSALECKKSVSQHAFCTGM
jgi:hypothetical protein